MIYTVANTLEAGRPVKAVLDANGLEWKYVLECDTETGHIVRFKTAPDGTWVFEPNGDVAREDVYAAPPLVVLFR